jgi:hypothetical protein
MSDDYSNIGLKKEVRGMVKLAAAEVAAQDPYKFMAVIGKTVIHPGGRASTQALLARAGITAASTVLDVGCGVGLDVPSEPDAVVAGTGHERPGVRRLPHGHSLSAGIPR